MTEQKQWLVPWSYEEHCYYEPIYGLASLQSGPTHECASERLAWLFYYNETFEQVQGLNQQLGRAQARLDELK